MDTTEYIIIIIIIAFLTLSKKIWEEVITYFPLVRHGPHRSRRVKKSYVVVCVFFVVVTNIFTGPLPSNNMGIRIQTHRLMGQIYELRR
jgi:hypothetical protein